MSRESVFQFTAPPVRSIRGVSGRGEMNRREKSLSLVAWGPRGTRKCNRQSHKKCNEGFDRAARSRPEYARVFRQERGQRDETRIKSNAKKRREWDARGGGWRKGVGRRGGGEKLAAARFKLRNNSRGACYSWGTMFSF